MVRLKPSISDQCDIPELSPRPVSSLKRERVLDFPVHRCLQRPLLSPLPSLRHLSPVHLYLDSVSSPRSWRLQALPHFINSSLVSIHCQTALSSCHLPGDGPAAPSPSDSVYKFVSQPSKPGIRSPKTSLPSGSALRHTLKSPIHDFSRPLIPSAEVYLCLSNAAGRCPHSLKAFWGGGGRKCPCVENYRPGKLTERLNEEGWGS